MHDKFISALTIDTQMTTVTQG